MSYSYVAVVVQIIIGMVAGIAVIRYARVRWAGILIILVGLLAGAAQLVELMNTDEKLSSCVVSFKAVHAMSKMYELDSLYDRADGFTRDRFQSELLAACQAVQGVPFGDRTRLNVEGANWDRSHEVINAHIVAYVRISELDPDLLNRAKVFGLLLSDFGGCPYDLHDWQRVARLVEKDPRRVIGSGELVTQRLGRHRDRVIAYCLSGWYVRKQQYSIALARLERALGEEWIRGGNVDQWWRQHLPPQSEDRLFFGYVLFRAGHESRALREFRLSAGHQNATLQQMHAAYGKWPAG